MRQGSNFADIQAFCSFCVDKVNGWFFFVVVWQGIYDPDQTQEKDGD